LTASPNPGGQNRRLVRTALAQWLMAQRIQGLDHVYRSRPPEAALDLYRNGAAPYSCQAWITMPSDGEERLVKTGPILPTGKIIHYTVRLEIWHKSYEPGENDWADDEDDYDRIYDALKDCLRAGGRQIGRGDAIVSVGEFREGLAGQHGEPEEDDGAVERNGALSFIVTQVI
jgi:hypothetical protein